MSNLYYIDPEDQEILQELRQVRMSLIEAIERCPEQQLESIWATDLGDRYWALVRSGIQKEVMTPTEEQKKHSVTQKLNPSAGGGFGTPGAINAVLIAMVLFEPGTMQISDADKKLPAWLLPSYQQIFAEPLGSAGLRPAERMRVLISHTNFPAQFRRLAPALVEQGHEVVFIAKNSEWHAPDPVSGMRVISYDTHRPGGGEALHPYLRRFESCVLEGQAVLPLFVSSFVRRVGFRIGF